MFESTPYEIKFIQKASPSESERDAFSCVYIYTFITKNKLKYVVRVEEHKHNLYILKYYAKRDKRKEDKYSIVINNDDAIRILVTCLEVMKKVLARCPHASFAFNAASSVDDDVKESYNNNQRFRIYEGMIHRTILEDTFDHYSFKDISSYLLLNKQSGNTEELKNAVVENLLDVYNFDQLI